MSKITKQLFLQHIKDPKFTLTQSFLASCRRVIDSSDDHENTPLIWAAINNDTSKVIQLAIAGADVHATNKDGDTAMMWVAFYSNMPAIRVLLQKGAEMDEESHYGDTPLIWAAINGKADAVRVILHEASFLLNKPSGFGVTALMVAAGEGHEEVVSALVDEWGADLYAADANGLNALMWAERARQKKTADIIEQAMERHPLGVVNPPLPQSRFAGVWKEAETPQQQGPREKIIRGSAVPVLVDFYADYCPPCRAISPLLDQLQQDYGSRLTAMKVDTTGIRDNSAPDALFFKTMMDDLSVRAIPTLALFRQGECIAVKRDGGTLDELKRWIEVHWEAVQTPQVPKPL